MPTKAIGRCPRCGTRADGLCPSCRARSEAERGTKQQRGYDAAHDAERVRWGPAVAAGIVTCARCHQPIEPGSAWDLGHTDDRAAWTGPEHPRCNRGRRPSTARARQPR